MTCGHVSARPVRRPIGPGTRTVDPLRHPGGAGHARIVGIHSVVPIVGQTLSHGVAPRTRTKGIDLMAAMKPRTGDGPIEAAKEGRGIVMRVPLEGGGRLVVELTPDEAKSLGVELANATS